MNIVRDDAWGTSQISGWFHPERKRCLTCRKFFGFIVIKRLYCSYPCAGMTPPSDDPTDWPREHRRATGIESKVGYNSPEDVQRSQQTEETIHLYPCTYCGMYHLGHK